MSRRPKSVENSGRRGSSLDSLGGNNSRPSSSGRRGSGHRKEEPKPVFGLSGGSDALRRVMRQLTRDSMADKNLAETEGEEEFFCDNDLDSDEDTTDKSDVGEIPEISDIVPENEPGHVYKGRYLSCKRYPWICLRSNCQHKKAFSGDYKAIIDKNHK